VTEVMSGRVDYYFSPIAPVIGQIKNGQLVPLAVGSPKRASALPQVPTTAEAGVPGSEFNFWIGMFAPGKDAEGHRRPPAGRSGQGAEHARGQGTLRRPGRRRLDPLSPSSSTPTSSDEIKSNAVLVKAAGLPEVHPVIRSPGRTRVRPPHYPTPREKDPMATQRLGIIMHGVTGRMGMNQHLIRSIVAIRNQGGVTLSNGDKVMPDPILIGRNAEKIEALAKAHGIERWGTDLDEALAEQGRHRLLRRRHHADAPHLLAKALRAGKHVYCEKPIATTWAKRWRSPSWPRSPA
jgi:hypothetical protein